MESLTLVEQDTGHPLLQLLGLKPGEAGMPGAAATSTKEEWAQEARRLELQGKQEQAQAIRDTFLKRPVPPWTPWSEAWARELLPKVVDPKYPSAKQRQAVFEYAMWHGQHRVIERLLEAVPAFSPTIRDAVAVRDRHLQPWSGRQFKDVLRQCDQFGVDHRVPEGSTPLMMAALAGQLDLVDALLARGADPALRDDFGHTAWWWVLSRAFDDVPWVRRMLGPLIERLAPAVIDVQTGHRLVRLTPHQAEYWVLSVMLAGFKVLGSRSMKRVDALYRYRLGFFNAHLRLVLDALPEHLWSAQRRKRDYVSGVLARAEVHSNYRPSRQLWSRMGNGYYMPNPAMHLRVRVQAGGDEGDLVWRPVYEVLNLAWVDEGTGHRELPGGHYGETLDQLVPADAKTSGPGSI